MNKFGQEGQALTTIFIFLLLVLFLGVFVYLSSAAAFLSRTPSEANIVETSVSYTNIAEPTDSFLQQPILLTPANGHALTVPLYRAVFLYYVYNSQKTSLDARFEHPTAKDNLNELADLRVKLDNEGITYQVLDSALRSFFAQKARGQAEKCFVFGIAQDTRLDNRINSPQESFGKSFYADFFYSFYGNSVDKLNRQTFSLRYRDVLSSSGLVSTNLKTSSNSESKDILIQHYLGSCSGGIA